MTQVTAVVQKDPWDKWCLNFRVPALWRLCKCTNGKFGPIDKFFEKGGKSGSLGPFLIFFFKFQVEITESTGLMQQCCSC